ncbi:MAG: MFS transporter permease [Cyanobacteriota bacterium]|nr:MFS transporter permease [Cyanobacteriota bacterium]
MSASALQAMGIFMAILGLISGLIMRSIPVYVVASIMSLIAVWLGYFQKRKLGDIPEVFEISTSQMQDWLDRWTQVHGSIAKLLPLPSNAQSSTVENNAIDPELTAYSFDRLVVCQSDAIAQMLIANQFHLHNNSAVLSMTGYPQNIFETMMQMLRRNQNLTVYALHDCSPAGLELIEQLQTNPTWFADCDIPIVDVGLYPRQVFAARRDIRFLRSTTSARKAQNLPVRIRQSLSQQERKWLDAGNFIELESFTPQKLIQVLQRRMAGNQPVQNPNTNSEQNDFSFAEDRPEYIASSFG